jgi:hypothetical protein
VDDTPAVQLIQNESWDGSAWTETGDMNTNRIDHGGEAASNTSAISFWWRCASSEHLILKFGTEARWTEVNDLAHSKKCIRRRWFRLRQL